jgi:hypothetical protein
MRAPSPASTSPGCHPKCPVSQVTATAELGKHGVGAVVVASDRVPPWNVPVDVIGQQPHAASRAVVRPPFGPWHATVTEAAVRPKGRLPTRLGSPSRRRPSSGPATTRRLPGYRPHPPPQGEREKSRHRPIPLHLAFGWAMSVQEVSYGDGRRCRQRPATSSSRGTSPNGYTMASAIQALGVLANRPATTSRTVQPATP